MKHVLFHIAIAANLAMTTPTIELAPELVERAPKSISELATFDDIPANPNPDLSPIPRPYHELDIVFAYNMQGTNSGVWPHSPPNYIANGPAAPADNIIMITNQLGNATSFDFQSWWFGCLDATNPLLSTACVFEITTFTSYTTPAFGSQSFEYKPNKVSNATMAEAKPGKYFTGVIELYINLTSSAAGIGNTILLLDSIKYIANLE